MNNILDNMNLKVENCRRCGDEKKVNKFGLCEACAAEVDHEYAVMYRVKNMEY